MALNNFTDSEAIEVCIALRDKLPFDENLSLKENWREKDALAQIIGLAEERIREKRQNG